MCLLHTFSQVELLEEELVGRKSYWRRQRYREDELTIVEAKLMKEMLENEDVTAQAVQEKQETINESTISFEFLELPLFALYFLIPVSKGTSVLKYIEFLAELLDFSTHVFKTRFYFTKGCTQALECT